MAGNLNSSGPRSDEPMWRTRPGEDLSWRCWDGQYVVFNPASGNTHLLDVATGEVLRCLVRAPTHIHGIARGLAGFLEVGNDDGLLAAARHILDGLEDAGLIEPVAECC